MPTYCPYTILQCEYGASASVVRKQYHLLAKILHPDKHPVNEKSHSAEMFQKVTECFDLLKNDVKLQVFNFYTRNGTKRTPEDFSEAWKNAQKWTNRDDEFQTSSLKRNIENTLAREAQEKLYKENGQGSAYKSMNKARQGNVEIVDFEKEDMKDTIYSLTQKLREETNLREKLEKESTSLCKEMQDKMKCVNLQKQELNEKIQALTLQLSNEATQRQKDVLASDLLAKEIQTKIEFMENKEVQIQQRIVELEDERLLLKMKIEDKETANNLIKVQLVEYQDAIVQLEMKLEGKQNDNINMNKEITQSKEAVLQLQKRLAEQNETHKLQLQKLQKELTEVEGLNQKKTLKQRTSLPLNHTRRGSHTCKQCGIVLKTTLTFTKHMKIHSREQVRHCPVTGCGISFSREDSLVRHLKNQHHCTNEKASLMAKSGYANKELV